VADESSWHLDKKVPITLIGAILIQTFVLGAWTASISSRVGYLESGQPSTIAEFAKLETARESTNLSLNTLQGDVKSLLELARRNESRNVLKDQVEK
jgi:hypothetical protein